MKKNISILYPESEFTTEQLQKLQFAGEVSYLDSKRESSLKDLVRISKGADIIAFSPDRLGKYASRYLSEILKASPKVKSLALNSTHTDYVDRQYCREKGISVSVVSNPAVVAMAEYAVLLLLGAARKIFINGWQAQKKMYKWELGSELAGKTLGIIGIDAVGERIVKIIKPFGVRIFICNEAPIRLEGAERKSPEEVLFDSYMLVINLPETEANKKFLNKEKLDRIKHKAVILNLSARSIVDEKAMAQALETGRVNQYVFETERLKSSPLDKIEQAIAFKKLSGHTKESVNRSRNVWVKNISDMAGHYTS